MIILKIVYIIIGTFVLIFLDGLFSALIGLKLIFILLLLLYKKVDWRILFSVMFLLFLITDVVYHYALGTSFLIALIALIFYSITSTFVSTTGIFSWLVKLVTFFIYYILLSTVPSLFLTQKFSNITLDTLLYSLLISAISVVITTSLQQLVSRVRDESGGKSKIKLS